MTYFGGLDELEILVLGEIILKVLLLLHMLVLDIMEHLHVLSLVIYVVHRRTRLRNDSRIQIVTTSHMHYFSIWVMCQRYLHRILARIHLVYIVAKTIDTTYSIDSHSILR